jgi:hypothetical protein
MMNGLAVSRGCFHLYPPMRRAYTGPDMRAVFNRYAGVALILLIALTGQGMAMARTAPGPMGQVELCTGSGPVMVYLDETGAPVAPPHICPDYALSLILMVVEPDFAPERAIAPRRLQPVRADLQNTALPQPRMVARAPPFSV